MKFPSNDVPTNDLQESSSSPYNQSRENRNLSSTNDFHANSVRIQAVPPDTNIISDDQESHSPTDGNNPSEDMELFQRLELSIGQRVIVGSGHILNDLCASLWFSYLLLYLQNVVKLSSDYAAYLMLLGQIVDGISTPLIGYEADRSADCVFCRKGTGRCKSWHLFGVILVTISFPFVFSPCIGYDGQDDFVKLIYYAPFIVIFQIGWASTQISHLALIPKMNPDELVRTELLAIRYGFTVFSNITVFILAWQTFGLSEDQEIDETDKFKFRNVAFISVGIGLVFSILFHVLVKEESDEHIKKCVAFMNSHDSSRSGSFDSNHAVGRNIRGREDIHEYNVRSEDRRALLSADSDDTDASDNQGTDFEPSVNFQPRNNQNRRISAGSVRRRDNENQGDVVIHQPSHRLSTRGLSIGKENMLIKDWLMLPQFYGVALVYMATRLSVNITQVYVPLYLQKSLKLPQSSVATVPLTMYCFGFIVAIFIKLINKYIGRQLSYLFGACLTMSGSVLIFLLVGHGNDYLSKYGIYGAAALLGGGSSAILVTSLSITADMVGNNVESGAFVFGAMSFTDKLSCGIAVMAINYLVPCQKDDSCSKAQDGELKPFYRNVLSFASGGFALVGVLGILLLTLYLLFRSHRRPPSHHSLDSNSSEYIE